MKMFTALEAARANARRIALYNRLNPMMPSVAHAVAAKCSSTETAFAVASEAMQILEGMGWLKNIPLRRFLEMRGQA